MVEIASPHVAGYSLDAKVNATEMLVREVLEKFCYINSEVDSELEWRDQKKIVVKKIKDISCEKDIFDLLVSLYNPHVDTSNLLNEGEVLTSENRAKHFDNLRKKYPKNQK